MINFNIKGKKYTGEQALEKFYEDFFGLMELYKSFKMADDGDICRFYGNFLAQSDRDPIKDADIIESDLYDEGWTDENLSLLFSNYKEEIINELCDRSRGGFDVFLYNWTSGDFSLGGVPMGDSDYEEILIRYSYGWSKTKYGRLYLKQSGLLDDFNSIAANAFCEDVLKTHISKFLRSYSIILEFEKLRKFIDIADNVITLKYKKIIDAINLMMFMSLGGNEERYSYEDFVDKLISDINGLRKIGKTLPIDVTRQISDSPGENEDELIITFN